MFKTSIDQHAGRTSFARVLSGTIKADSTLLNAATGNPERLGKIANVVGKDVKNVDEAGAGDIVALQKLKATLSGQTLSDEKHPFALQPRPSCRPRSSRAASSSRARAPRRRSAPPSTASPKRIPGLSRRTWTRRRASWSSPGLGALHLEITVERIRRRVGIDCRLGPPHIAYKETITRKVAGVEGKHKKQSGGHGQFGVCYIDIEPNPRGDGFVFEDAVVGGSIPRQFIPSVEKGIVKAMARGFLAGFQMIDVKVRVYDGKYHDVDSSDAAFQLAGSKGFKAACAQAKPVLLEPIVKLQVTVPSAAMGDVIGDINSRRGRISGTDTVDDNTIVNAFVPALRGARVRVEAQEHDPGQGHVLDDGRPPRRCARPWCRRR